MNNHINENNVGVTGHIDFQNVKKCICRPLIKPFSQNQPGVRDNNINDNNPMFDANGNPISGFYPNQIRNAYGLYRVPADGTGETIAIVGAYDYPQVASDFAVFDQTFKINRPNNITVMYLPGTTGTMGDSSYSLEASLDTQWAHALAPGAQILLILAPNNGTSLIFSTPGTTGATGSAINAANASSAGVVSISFAIPEVDVGEFNELVFDQNFTVANKVYCAGSGDLSGTTNYPASSPNVVAVGGTQLGSSGPSGTFVTSLTQFGYRVSPNVGVDPEIAWGTSTDNFPGSAGGPSLYEAIPSYQLTYGLTGSTKRQTPDISFVGSFDSGVAIYNTQIGPTGWSIQAGTSLSTPCIAAIITLANQLRVAKGKTRLSNPVNGTPSFLNALYNTLGTTGSVSYATDFYDITQGQSYPNFAGPGYDYVNGLGTPNNPNDLSGFVYDLVNNVP